jgi:FkbM family methyltransferase
MEGAILKILESLGSLLPDRLWRIILNSFVQNRRLMDLYGMYYFSKFASQLNIISVSTAGKYGIFASAPNDNAVFKAYAKTGEWAASTNRTIRHFFAGGQGTYLDIGANIGMTVVPIAADTGVKCFAFEPDPTNYRNLQINVAVNCGSKNVKIFNCALFDREAVLPFELSPDNLGDHRVRLGNIAPGRLAENMRQVVEVQCTRLDDLDLPIQSPFLVKIDTQGAEPFVVAGGRSTLAKADVILMEWAPYYMTRMGGDPYIILEFLRANFATAKIKDAESDQDEAVFQPMAEVCSALTKTFAEWRNNPSSYVDVVAKRG